MPQCGRSYTCGVKVSEERHLRDAGRTRDRILAVARTSFAQRGYDGTTVRHVASAAGVAPNLITRYFGSKTGLFHAATAVDLGVPMVLPGPWESLGGRIAAKVVTRWEAASHDDPLLMMLRSAGTSAAAASTLGAFFAEQAAAPLTAYITTERGCPDRVAAERAAAVGALIMGVVMSRYVVAAGPLAAATPPTLTDWLGDALQRLLDDPPLPSLQP